MTDTSLVTPSQRPPTALHIGYLDGWRGCAIALVLEAHFLGALPFDTGRLGVDVFFCLSGFLMSGLLFIERQPLPTFYRRRVSRILPAFLVFVATIFGIAFASSVTVRGTEFVATILFLRTYLPTEPGIWNSGVPIGHLWSLNVEEHCYLLMTALVLFRRFRGGEGIVLLVAGAISIGIGLHYARMGSAAPHWGALGTEVAASHLLISAGYRLIREKLDLRMPRHFPLVALIMLPFFYSKLLPWWTASVFSPVVLAIAINHLHQTADTLKSMLSIPPLRLLGLWSFSLYLWQQPFYANKSIMPGGPLGAFVAATTVALLSFYLLERPARAWLNKYWGTR